MVLQHQAIGPGTGDVRKRFRSCDGLQWRKEKSFLLIMPDHKLYCAIAEIAFTIEVEDGPLVMVDARTQVAI